MTITALIQARMGSTRLPGKVLMDIAGKPMLLRVVERIEQSKLIDRAVVATSILPADDRIVRFCMEKKISCGRGSEHDVLDRFYTIIKNQFPSDIIVRITSDCPLIEPAIIDAVIGKILDRKDGADYACNFLPARTYPRGLDTEVFTRKALRRAWIEDKTPEWREHVTPYIYRNPHLFHIAGIQNERDLSGMRWTVDTWEDLEFVRKIYAQFGNRSFSWQDVVRFLESHPEVRKINEHVVQKILS